MSLQLKQLWSQFCIVLKEEPVKKEKREKTFLTLRRELLRPVRRRLEYNTAKAPPTGVSRYSSCFIRHLTTIFSRLLVFREDLKFETMHTAVQGDGCVQKKE